VAGQGLAIPIVGLSSKVSAKDAALAAIAAYPELLGLDPMKDTLSVAGVMPRPKGGALVHLVQHHEGIEVLGGRLTVVVDGQRRITALLGHTCPGITASSVPATSSSAAVAKLGGQGKGVTAATTHLAYLDVGRVLDQPNLPPALVWRIRARDTSGAPWEHLVDAHSGKLYSSQSRALDALAPQSLYDQDFEGGRLRVESESGGASGWCAYPPDTYPGCRPLMPQLERDAWDGMTAVNTYLWDRYSRSSYDGEGSQMNLRIGGDPCNAGYDLDEQRVSVGTNSVATHSIAHEWGHGVNDTSLYGGGYPFHVTDDPRSIDEGLADCMAAMVEDSWCVAPEVAVQCYQSPAGTCARNQIYPELGEWGTAPATVGTLPSWGYRDYIEHRPNELTDEYMNSLLASNPCYMISALPPNQTPPASCTTNNDCLSACTASAGTPCPQALCGTSAMGNGDLTGRCVHVRNNVPVPYIGRYRGHAPFYYAVARWLLDPYSDFTDFFYAMWEAACEYDEDLGLERCENIGRAMYYGLFATGLWEATGPTNADEQSIQTAHRPAMVDNVRPGSGTNKLGMFYVQPNGSMKWTSCENGVDFGAPTAVGYNATSGITAVRNSPTPSSDLVLLYTRPQSTAIQVLTADLTANGPQFDRPTEWEASDPAFATDLRPGAAVLGNQLCMVWKKAGTSHLYSRLYGETGPAYRLTSQVADTTFAPSVVAAEGRVWVVWRTQSGGLDMVSSASCSEWSGVSQVPILDDNGIPETDFGPEAYYYEGRIWVVFQQDQRARMVSFVPLSNGLYDSDLRSRVVYLKTTQVVNGGAQNNPFFSLIKFNPHLRLYYSYDAEEEISPVWQIAKEGNG